MGITGDVHACIRIIKEHAYHWHEDLTIVMVVAGQISLRVRANDNYMSAGDILVLNNGEIHKLTALTEDNLVAIITLGRELCLRTCEDYNETVILCNSVKYGKVYTTMYQELRNLARQVIYTYGSDESCTKIEETAKDLITYLCYYFDYVSNGVGHSRFSDYIISRNKMLYKKVFQEKSELTDMNLKQLSKYLGINYTYFRTDIIERFGCGYNWLKHSLMTENAARIVLSTDLRLIDISNQCGFSDQKYFRKYFKIFYDCTPSEFRRKYKKEGMEDAFVEIPLKYAIRFCKTFNEL